MSFQPENNNTLTAAHLAALASSRKKAIAALVLSIGSIFFAGLLAIIALPVGYSAKRTHRMFPEEAYKYGAGMARTAIIIGWVAVGLGVAALIFGTTAGG